MRSTRGSTGPRARPAGSGARGRPSVLVVGGGVIGLSVARALSAGGADVVLLERERCGAGASPGNAGWVTPALCAPIPEPGLPRLALGWMLDPESPLLVRPRLDPAFWSWSAHFLRNCTARRHAAGLRATWALARRAVPAFDRLRADGVSFEQYSDGLLFLTRSTRALDRWVELFKGLRSLGYAGHAQVLGGEELRSLEPAVAQGVAGGLHADAERHVRPESLCAGLKARLLELGAVVREGAPVRRLAATRGGWRAETPSGSFTADHAVVAAGIWSRPLLDGLGLRLPLEAAKGYSVTTSDGATLPGRPLYLTEIKVGVSPYAGAVRVAGTLEMTGINGRLRPRRLAALVAGVADYVRDWSPGGAPAGWAGLRPLAPDGVPILGGVPGHRGLFVATGHGMLGVTLAPATGEALATMVLENRTPPELDGLLPARFLGRRAGATGY